VIAIVPIIVGAGVLLLLFTVLIALLQPYLPSEYRRVLELVQQGDLVAGRDSLRAILEAYGGAQYAAFVALQVGQVLFAPIPGQLAGLLGGYMFGFVRGLGLTMLGLTIGSLIAFSLARLLGIGVVRRVVPAAILARFERLVDASSIWDFFLIFLLPLFPDDAICFIAGLTRLPIWQLVLASVFGRLPWMAALTQVGATSQENAPWTIALLTVVVIAGLALWLFSEEVEGWFRGLLRSGRVGD
jgi:uncharacterized membrane protein YdjX (TVP38/TMEM64 family)